MDAKGKTALVTGASSGIGVAFAQQLAEMGADVVITARREDRLEALAEELRAKHGVSVTVIAADLSDPSAPALLFERTEGAGMTVDILVNNAGYGTLKPFVELPWEKWAHQLNVNVWSLAQLTHLYGTVMCERGRGWIMNVASIGAYLPSAGYATYSPGKTFVRNFSESVAAELAPKGVKVTCVCPGATDSEFMEVAGYDMPFWQKPVLMSSTRCAKIGLRALFRGRRTVVTGYLNAFGMWMLRFVPRRMLVWVAGKFIT